MQQFPVVIFDQNYLNELIDEIKKSGGEAGTLLHLQVVHLARTMIAFMSVIGREHAEEFIQYMLGFLATVIEGMVDVSDDTSNKFLN